MMRNLSKEICRLCCEKVAVSNSIKIPADFFHRFQELTSYELINSPEYSSTMCMECMAKFDNFSKYRQQLIDTQIRMKSLNLFPSQQPRVEIMNEFTPMKFNDCNMFDEIDISKFDDRHARKVKVELVDIKQETDDIDDAFDDYDQCEVLDGDFSDLDSAPSTSVKTEKLNSTTIEKKTQKSKICATKVNFAAKTRKKSAENFFCEICGQLFKAKTEFQKHMKFHRRAKFTCDYCGKTVTNKRLLLVHISSFHIKGLPTEMQCDICGKGFYSKCVFNYHRKVVHESGAYNCKMCDFVARNVYHLQSHRWKVHERKRFCDICGNWFSSRDIKYHMRVKNHIFSYKCTVDSCPKVFSTEQGLDTHVRFYHKKTEGCFTCDECNRAYPTEKKLHRHISRTHKAQLIPCPISGCSYKAKRKEYFKCHVKGNHKDLNEAEKHILFEQIKQIKGSFH